MLPWGAIAVHTLSAHRSKPRRPHTSYLISYIIKDPVKITAMVLIQRVRRKALRFGSVAAEDACIQRSVRRAMNSTMKLAEEVPGVMAAMVLRGRSRFVSHHAYGYLNVTGAVNDVRAT